MKEYCEVVEGMRRLQHIAFIFMSTVISIVSIALCCCSRIFLPVFHFGWLQGSFSSVVAKQPKRLLPCDPLFGLMMLSKSGRTDLFLAARWKLEYVTVVSKHTMCEESLIG